MGWNPFKPQTKIILFSQTIPLFEDLGESKDYIKEAVLYSVSSETDIVNNLLKANANRRAVIDLESYYTYCRDNHPYGLPDSERVVAVLNELTPGQVSQLETTLLNYYFRDPFLTDLVLIDYKPVFLKDLDFLRIYLERRGSRDAYESTTLEFDFLDFRDNPSSQLEPGNVQAVNRGGKTINDFTLPEDTVTFALSAIESINRETVFVRNGPKREPSTEIVRLRIRLNQLIKIYSDRTEIYDKVDLYIVIPIDDVNKRGYEFTVNNNPFFPDRGREYKYRYSIKYPNYNVPELTFSEEKFPSQELYPIMPIRAEKEWIGRDGEYFIDKNFYDKTSAALSKINIDINSLTEKIAEDPGIDDVNGAFIFVGANMNSEYRSELKYIFEFFKNEYLENFAVGFGRNNYIEFRESRGSGNFQQFQAYNNLKFNAYNGTMPNNFNGQIRRVDDYSVSVYKVTNQAGEDGNLGYFVYAVRRQLSNGTWEEVLVEDFYQERVIYRDKRQTATAEALKDDPDTDELRIPVNRELLFSNLFTGDEREDIEYQSICLLIQGYDKVKVQWYQTSVFKIFVTALAIASVIITFGGSSNLSALALNIVYSIGIAYATKEIFTYLAQQLGAENAAIVVALAIIVSVVARDGSSLSSIEYADVAIEATNAIAIAYSSYNEYELELLKEKYQEFINEQESVQEQLADLYEQYVQGTNPGANVNGFVYGLFEQSRQDDLFDISLSETPDQFIERTIHTINPGVNIIDNISNYVDTNIRLPDMTKEILT